MIRIVSGLLKRRPAYRSIQMLPHWRVSAERRKEKESRHERRLFLAIRRATEHSVALEP